MIKKDIIWVQFGASLKLDLDVHEAELHWEDRLKLLFYFEKLPHDKLCREMR